MIVYGHRGARGEAPENTLAGCRHAVERGVRHFEIDLRLSADGQLVVIHDDSLLRTVGLRRKVSQLTAKELSQLSAICSGPPWTGKGKGKRGTGVPRWETVYKDLPMVKHWQLELKSGSKTYNRQLVEATVKWIGKARKRCTVTSFNPEILAAVKEALPGQSIGLITESRSPMKQAEALKASHLIGHWKILNPKLIRQAHNQGLHVSTWTVNDASVIEKLFEQGVDSVITDYPSMAIPLVAQLTR